MSESNSIMIKMGRYLTEDNTVMTLESVIIPGKETIGYGEGNFVAIFSYADPLGFLREAAYEKEEFTNLTYLGK